MGLEVVLISSNDLKAGHDYPLFLFLYMDCTALPCISLANGLNPPV